MYCYGATGRILNGDIIANSLVLLSYRVTLAAIEGGREVHGDRDAVITKGPLAGVEIKSSEVAGRSVVMKSPLGVGTLFCKLYSGHVPSHALAGFV